MVDNMSLPKVQSHGINKNVLIKLHQDLLENILDREYKLSDERLVDFTEFSRLHSQVILFGVSELEGSNFKYKTSIYSNFDPDYGGLNEFIQKTYQNRSYEDFSEWVLEKLKFAENFFMRALIDIPSDEVEDKFLAVIATLETFLQEQYAKLLLPGLIQIENEIKDGLVKIYNSNLSEEDAVAEMIEFLDQKEKESVEVFKTKIQDELNNKAIEEAIAAIAVLGLIVLSDSIIEQQKKIFEFGYLSNIGAFFFNEFRKVKESAFENLLQGTNKRSIATEQLKEMSFNKNIFKLSVITHPRGLFRALIAKASDGKTDNFKAIVPEFVLPTLNPSGVTASVLYTIKTKDEWAKTNGLNNVNVVDGLGLHHGDQIYYKPILDLEKEKTLAQKQRQVFVDSLS